MHQKMPGLVKYNNITLKRGLMEGDTEFIDWINTIEMNAVERRDITIQLLNERHEPVCTWGVKNAFPVRYSGPRLQANANTIAIEELELAHEGLSLRS